jgi:thiamine pyrophosphate-dependent acetolactate synthase large subunit-like protein
MTTHDPRMTLHEALLPLHRGRGAEDVIITSMGAAREWMVLGAGPLDLPLVPSSMGTAPSIALGVALAQPERRVIVVNGDGAMLMHLGALVTITAAAPPNLTLILQDNGIYEVTGAQPTPGAAPARADGGSVDFVGMALACGFRSIFHFTDAEQWAREITRVLATEGPNFVLLDVQPVPGAVGPRSPGPAAARAHALQRCLAQPIKPRPR